MTVDERELRIALVMTGGVSLAVWMGGVSAEVYRLTKGEGVYGDLLELTGTRATVDIISGSSAGGLNGVFLGTAIARNITPTEFDKLRSLWFTAGSFAKLLRDPMKKDPPSLLRGDDYFTGQILGLLNEWVTKGHKVDFGRDSLTVVLTGSLLTPELRSRSDVFGIKIVEPVHRASFTFTAPHFTNVESLLERLALAARTSASFPGAFEPSFVPVGASMVRPTRPDMAGIASFETSRWVIDGGVLLNKPVAPAVKIIEKRSASGETRRVLAYVNPDPGSPQPDIDLADDMPTLGQVVLKALVTLPRTESIADDLSDIAHYNQRFGGQRRERDRILWGDWALPTTAPTDDAAQPGGPAAAQQGDAAQQGVTADPKGPNATDKRLDPVRPVDPIIVRLRITAVALQVYALWVRRRTVQAVRVRLEAHLSRTGNQVSTVIRSLDGHGFSYRELQKALEEMRLRIGWLPSRIPTVEALAVGNEWTYGFTPLEYIGNLALDLVRRAYALLPVGSVDPGGQVEALRVELAAIRHAVHVERSWLQALREADDDYYAYWLDHLDQLQVPMCATDLAAALYGRWPAPPVDLFATGPDGHTDPSRIRAWTMVKLLMQGSDQQTELGSPEDAASREVLSSGFEKKYPDPPGALREAELRIGRRLAADLQRLGPVLVAAANLFTNIYVRPTSAVAGVECPPVFEPWEPEVLLQTAAVLGLVPVDGASPEDPAEVLIRASQLFFVQAIVEEDDVVASGAQIEFAQISASAPNQLVPDRTLPADKVAGLQLGHFGAFLKESWRANDWLWGTLDGASRLVPLLLEPNRLRQKFRSRDVALAAVKAIAVGTSTGTKTLLESERVWLEREWTTLHEAAVRAELSYLDPASGLPVPPELPETTKVLTRVLQLLVAARELPEVSASVVRSTDDGANENTAASVFVESIGKAKHAEGGSGRLHIEEVPALMAKCDVGLERVVDELGSDAGAATATKAAAVAATAASGSRSGLGALRHAFGAIRAALLTVYFTAVAASRRSKIGFALVTLLLAIGAGVIAARLVGGRVPDAVLVVAIFSLSFWMLLTGFTARAWRYTIASTCILAAVALSFLPAKSVCPTFAKTCTEGVDQPNWKATVRIVIPVVFGLLALVAVFVAWGRAQKARTERARTGRKQPKSPMWISIASALGLAGMAALYPTLLHFLLFTGDGLHGSRRTVVRALEGWSRTNVLVVFIGLPLVFILLGYTRQVYRDARMAGTRRRAYIRARMGQPKGQP